MQKLIIIDASVSLKWLIKENEPFQDEALRLLKDFYEKKIIVKVSHIWLSEICNILPRKIQDHSMLCELVSGLMLYKIEKVMMNLSMISIAFEIMLEFPKVSFYDASYHALALKEGGVFLTADKKYYNMTKKKGAIMWLGDYGK